VTGDFAATADRERATTKNVVLIGFKRQGNLGLGYLASTLRARGYCVAILDFEDDYEEIRSATVRLEPIVVGFSLIFQFYIHRFHELITRLRADGVTAHFTMGGHFPSLSHDQTISLVPELDSVVRFEGELTLLELVDALSLGRDWRQVAGLAYDSPEGIVTTEMRPLLRDLDELPYPDRDVAPPMMLGLAEMQMLASRGCARTCSFCSIHMFYRTAPGKVVRTRKPSEVVREMSVLYDQWGVRIFLFQDDDFPIFGPVWHRWVREFLGCLWESGLAEKAIWKINCRADAVDPELFVEMRDAGLCSVYMGLESGTEDGLRTLNKLITVEQNVRAVDILKNLDIIFDFGFMMLDPSSTFDSIFENVRFLRRIAGDGYAAAEFCRMIPYDGTPIKDQLAREGRLRGDVVGPDYSFLDERLDTFYREINEALNITGWIHGIRALSPQLKFAWGEYALLARLFPGLAGLHSYRGDLTKITRESNAVLFEVVEDVARACMGTHRQRFQAASLEAKCKAFVSALYEARNAFILEHQDMMRVRLREVRTAPRLQHSIA
jgi:anaerobic magnesium-protoporphyrin IX monomethyl ester cyclase